MKPLRQEVEEIIQREGWTKAGLDQMSKLDSFIKESQRLHPTTLSKLMSYIVYAPKVNAFLVAMQRIAVNDYTFTDGTTVPRGASVGVALDSVHMNDKIYPDAHTFDPFRFVKLKEQDATGRKFDIVTTSNDALTFGHGRHACPGRYFAACLIKLMFAHVLTNYDVKLETEGVRPRDLWVVGSCVPNPNAKILFRKRVL
jgi:cytochrome P450